MIKDRQSKLLKLLFSKPTIPKIDGELVVRDLAPIVLKLGVKSKTVLLVFERIGEDNDLMSTLYCIDLKGVSSKSSLWLTSVQGSSLERDKISPNPSSFVSSSEARAILKKAKRYEEICSFIERSKTLRTLAEELFDHD